MRYELLVLPRDAIVVSESTPINEGDSVKIVVSAGDTQEKFWATVYAIDRDKDEFGVRIDQDLMLTKFHGLYNGDELTVKRNHIVALL